MVASLFRPWMIMSMSVFYLMVTVVKLIVKGDLATLLSWEAFNDAWFGNFWTTMGPMSKSEGEPWVEPLLAGRVRAGRVTEKAGSGESPISGVVLEVGAGSGMWTDVLSGIVRSSAAVDKIYGVEPNPISAAALRQRVEKVGLAGTYEVVPVGIEDLADEADIGPGSVDCIVTVQCLCSIPEPQKNIRMLYDYLKEGGRWYVYEHVRNDNGGAVSLVQRLINIPWEYLVGSCHLCRPTRDWILEAGEWDSVDLASRHGESSDDMIPHIIGTVTKAVKK